MVCHFDMLENAYFYRPRIHQIAFGGRAPPGPAGELTALPQIPSLGGWGSAPNSQNQRRGGAGDKNEREEERNKEMNHTKQREKRDQGKGRETWNNGVFVPYCGSALLATI